MKTEDEKNKILLLRNEALLYKVIANITGLSRDCIRGICLQRSIKRKKEKRAKVENNCNQ